MRRAMRAELEGGSFERWIAHSQVYINALNQPVVRYSFQYRNAGGKALVKLAKKIYRLSGVLPRKQNG